MRSRKKAVYRITSWVVFLCVAVLASGIAGCEKDVRDETEFVELGDETVSERSGASDAETETGAGAGTEAEAGTGAEAGIGAGTEAGAEAGTGAEAEGIYVDVCGQVKVPGVYLLPKSGRVFEAVERAGGMTEKAAASYVNQAQKLTDGEQIYIPSKEEVQEEAQGENCSRTGVRDGLSGAQKTGGNDDGKISLNTASKEELMTLTGIGEVKAEAIIRYREEQGGFQSIEDLKKIEGIKDGVFNKVKDQIRI